MKKDNKRNGFTLVELLVVIAILAVLASVSVIGYLSFVKKSKVSNDSSLITQMNTTLQANEAVDGKNATAHDAIEELYESGLDVNKLSPTTEGYHYAIDMSQNRAFLLDGDYNKVAPENLSISNDKEDVFVMVGSYDQISTINDEGYSVYLKNGFDWGTQTSKEITTSKGIDVGENEVSTINYTRTNVTDNQEVVIRTNSASTDLNVNAPKDTINHYGYGKILTITAIDTDCFNEYGAFGNASISTGKLIAKDGGFIGIATNSDDAEILEEKGGYIGFLNGTQNQTSYAIYNLKDLLAFRNRVNAGFSFKDITVTLEADIDLKGIEWVPIGTYIKRVVGVSAAELVPVNPFEGNFDGKNHTINNLESTVIESDENNCPGFFGAIEGEYVDKVRVNWTCSSINLVEIKNINFTNVNIKSGDYKSGILASEVSCAKISNVNVQGTMRGSQLGGIVGYAADSQFYNCKVDVEFQITVCSKYEADPNNAYYSIVGGVCHQAANNYEPNPKFEFDILSCDTSSCVFKKVDEKPTKPENATHEYLLGCGHYVGQTAYTKCFNLKIDLNNNGTFEDNEKGINNTIDASTLSSTVFETTTY